MQKEIKNIVLTALFIALGVALPQIFHLVNLGVEFSPMHLPVLIGGFILGWKYGLIIGFVTPLLSSVMTGMPIIYPMAVLMVFELGTYGALSGFLYRLKRPRLPWEIIHIFVTLIIAMVFGRVVFGIGMALNLGIKGQAYALKMFLNGVIISNLPGIILQLVIVPPLVFGLKKVIKF